MRITGHALWVYRLASRVAYWASWANLVATPVRMWLDRFEVVYLGGYDGFDFCRFPKKNHNVAWRLYAGWWLIRWYR